MDILTLIAAFIKSKKYTDENAVKKESGDFAIGKDDNGVYIIDKEAN